MAHVESSCGKHVQELPRVCTENNNVKVSLPGGELEIDYLDNKNIIMTGPTKLDYKDQYTI